MSLKKEWLKNDDEEEKDSPVDEDKDPPTEIPQ